MTQASDVLLCMNMNSIALLSDRKTKYAVPLLSLDRLPIESSPIDWMTKVMIMNAMMNRIETRTALDGVHARADAWAIGFAPSSPLD